MLLIGGCPKWGLSGPGTWWNSVTDVSVPPMESTADGALSCHLTYKKSFQRQKPCYLMFGTFFGYLLFFGKAQELDITGILQLGFCRKQNPLGQAVWESHPHVKADKPKEALTLWGQLSSGC